MDCTSGPPRPVLLGVVEEESVAKHPQPRLASPLPWLALSLNSRAGFCHRPRLQSSLRAVSCSSPCPFRPRGGSSQRCWPGNRTLTCLPYTLHPARKLPHSYCARAQHA